MFQGFVGHSLFFDILEETASTRGFEIGSRYGWKRRRD